MPAQPGDITVILADPPQIGNGYDRNYPNLGILYLAAFLRENYSLGRATIVHLPPWLSLEEHLHRLGEVNPDVYGLSFASLVMPIALTTVRSVKRAFPNTTIVCGGPGPTAEPERVLLSCPADFCVVGEGEVTLLELCQALRQRGEPSGIPGLAYLDGDKVHRTQPRPFLQDLKSVPWPAWDLVDFEDYAGLQLTQNKPHTGILVSRGCPYNCAFCSNPVWKSSKPWLRLRDPADVASEIQMLYERGAREIYMTSDEINASLPWATSLLQAICDLGLKDLRFQANIRADRVTHDFARLCGQAGVWLVHLGIESLNDRVLAGIGKHVTVAQVESACATLKRNGVRVYGFLMCFQAWEENGELCFETVTEVDRTLRRTAKLLRKGMLDYMSWQIACPVPGSKLADIARKYRLADGRELHPRSVWEPTITLPGTSPSLVRRYRRRGMLLQSWYSFLHGVKNREIEWGHWHRIRDKISYILRG